MKSIAIKTGVIELPNFIGHERMIPFDIDTLKGLSNSLKEVAETMLKGINHNGGEGFFTLHGKVLEPCGTLRRGGAHTDGNYDKHLMGFGSGGGNGFKVGEDGPPIGSHLHDRQYCTDKGGILMASNYASCLGWLGEFDDLPGVGGDCQHIELNKPFILEENGVYYGNNHFIHESLPVNEPIHRVLCRITMPEKTIFKQ